MSAAKKSPGGKTPASAEPPAPARDMSNLTRGLDPEDFYFDDGMFVFTAAYHLKRGNCCASGCRHCPYEPQ